MDPGDSFRIGEFKAFTAWRKQVPAQSSIADAAFQNHHRRVGHVSDVMPDADFRTDVSLDGHPRVCFDSHVAQAASHDAHVSDILPHRPFAVVVDQVGVKLLLVHRMRQRAIGFSLRRVDLAEAQHVRLPQQDVNLNRLVRVGRLSVRIRQFICSVRFRIREDHSGCRQKRNQQGDVVTSTFW